MKLDRARQAGGGLEFFDCAIQESADVFYAVDPERDTFTSGGSALDLAIRTSRIFRRAGGRCREMRHHGSIDAPRRLEACQNATQSLARAWSREQIACR